LTEGMPKWPSSFALMSGNLHGSGVHCVLLLFNRYYVARSPRYDVPFSIPLAESLAERGKARFESLKKHDSHGFIILTDIPFVHRPNRKKPIYKETRPSDKDKMEVVTRR